MEFKQIKQIVDLIKRSGLTEFQLEEKDFKLRICRQGEEIRTVVHGSTPPPFPFGTPASATPPQVGTPSHSPVTPPPVEKPVDESKLIKSPMVGTFYSAPSPESPPFVRESDPVNEETVVCIVEAMKVMNEIKAENKGVVAEILVENGESVEYGQPLFRLS